MKKLFFLITILLFAFQLNAKNLVDLYKSGGIVIQPDDDFAINTDWETVFGKRAGEAKYPQKFFTDIAVAGDGSVFAVNGKLYTISKFDENGNFLLKFGGKGKGQGKFQWPCGSIDILDEKYVIVSEYDCPKIHLFDLNGNFVKTIKTNYSVKDFVALTNNKIGIHGFKRNEKIKRGKDFVLILNVSTGDEKKLGEYTIYYAVPDSGQIGITGFGRTKRFFICKTKTGKLIAGFSGIPDIKVYDADGQELNSIHLNYKQLSNEFDEKLFRRDAAHIEKIMRKNIPDISEEKIKKNIEEFMSGRRKDFELNPLKPFFYDLWTDSDDNLLVLKVTEGNRFVHKFQVYSLEGEFVCESQLHLTKGWIHPKKELLTFHDGYLYGLVQKSEGTSGKMRLIRMKLLER